MSLRSSFVLSPVISPSAKSRQRGGRREVSGRSLRTTPCASGGRPHVAYVYFLQLTLRDSSRATRPSLTTALFTAAMKRASSIAPRRTARAWACKCARLALVNKNDGAFALTLTIAIVYFCKGIFTGYFRKKEIRVTRYSISFSFFTWEWHGWFKFSLTKMWKNKCFCRWYKKCEGIANVISLFPIYTNGIFYD